MKGSPTPYRSINPQEPTIGERAQDAWNNTVDDPGEPHDMPNPFANPKATTQQYIPGASSSTPPDQRAKERAQQSYQAGQKNAQLARDKRKVEDEKARKTGKMDEMKSILERLRDEREKEKTSS
ncbi:hypothetical protein CBS101457_000813 [Exobasidium rhododendri]|nr:hypothetical protein CBS101457_000813 [Exobasidium rhododendri]